MNLYCIITLLILISSASATNYNAIFALTWPAGHCEYLGYKCDRHKYEQWDHQSFTIHGLWPNQVTYHDYSDFNFNLFKGQLLQEMYNYWPPQPQSGGIPHFIWEYEWETNGQRFANLMLDLHPSDYVMYGIKKRNEELQIEYFRKTIEYYKELNVRKVPQKSYTKDEFSRLTKIPKNSFYFVCLENGVTFREVRICYKIMSYGLDFRTCAKTVSNCYDDTAVLKDWRSNQAAIIKDKPSQLSDAERQEQKSKVIPIYKPAQEKKEDESIAIKKVEDEKHKMDQQIAVIKVETQKQKQDMLIEQQKQINIEIELQDFNSEEQVLEEKEQKEAKRQVYDKQAVIQIVQGYIILTFFIVSIFWICLILVFVRVFRKRPIETQFTQETIQNRSKQ